MRCCESIRFVESCSEHIVGNRAAAPCWLLQRRQCAPRRKWATSDSSVLSSSISADAAALTIALLALAACCAASEGENAPRPLILGHRGASGSAPENTMAAFRLALAADADGIETDLRLSADNVVVLFHDAVRNGWGVILEL